MKAMKSFPELDYQKQLVYASLDDFTPNASLPDYKGGQFGQSNLAWRSAVVDFLCVNVASGLIVPVHREDLGPGQTSALRILLNGNGARGEDVEIVWNTLFFVGTALLIDILGRFNMRDWIYLHENSVDRRLMRALDGLYSTIPEI